MEENIQLPSAAKIHHLLHSFLFFSFLFAKDEKDTFKAKDTSVE